MCTLEEYGLPIEISEIERKKKLLGGTTKEIVARFGQSTLDKSVESGYLNAFTKMLHFEEAAQSQYLVQFNTKNIQVKRSDSNSEREFCIKNDVRNQFRHEPYTCFDADFFLSFPLPLKFVTVKGSYND